MIKGTPVVANGVLYVTIPDHVWALDARSGRELWHASWPSKGGWHIGNRGVAVLGTSVYVSTPDCHLLALDNRTGKEKWRTEICDLEQFYYASAAPLIVRNHVIVGVSGDDLDIPGYIESHDPETGARAVALVHASRARDARGEDVAERRGDAARRRDDVGVDHLRPGS